MSQIFPNIVLFADIFVCSILSSAILSKHYLSCSIFNSDDDYCSHIWCGWCSQCTDWCSCNYNGEKDHKDEEESFKLMEGDGRFKGREANSYNGEGGHKKEEGNFKPVEEDRRFEGGEDGNNSKDEDHKKEESNPKLVEDGEETASK